MLSSASPLRIARSYHWVRPEPSLFQVVLPAGWTLKPASPVAALETPVVFSVSPACCWWLLDLYSVAGPVATDSPWVLCVQLSTNLHFGTLHVVTHKLFLVC